MLLRILTALALAAPLLAGEVAIRPQVASMLPPDAPVIGGFEIQALRGTPLFRHLASRFPIEGDEQLDQIFAVAGFDPKQDITRILAAGEATPGGRSKATLVILEGRFDQESGLLSLFHPVGEHAGVRLYKALSGRGNPNDATFAFLDARTAVMAAGPQVEAAIDRWHSSSAPSNRALAATTQNGAHVWAVTFEPSKVLARWIDQVPGGGGPLGAITESMRSMAMRATALAGAVQAELAFQCAGPDDARSLADAAQTIAAFGVLAGEKNRPELADLLSKLQVRQEGAETTVAVEITEQQLSDLR